MVDQPRLIEVVRTAGAASLAGGARTVIPRALLRAEAGQATDGGSNPRFGPIFDARTGRIGVRGRAVLLRCSVTAPSSPLPSALPSRPAPSPAIACEPAHGFEGVSRPIASVVGRTDRSMPSSSRCRVTLVPAARSGWQDVLAGHRGITEGLHTDAARVARGRRLHDGRRSPSALAPLGDARTPAGRSRAQAAAQLARVAGAGTRRGASPRSPWASKRVGRCGAHCRCTRRAPPGHAGDSRPGGGRTGRPWMDRPAQPPPSDRHHHLRRSRHSPVARCRLSRHRCRHRAGPLRSRHERSPMTEPTRIVDAHVHLWDPANKAWYPYLAMLPHGSTGDPTRMHRRFDVRTYRTESAAWHVDKFVNVAAATGHNSVDETLELDRTAAANGGPDAIIGGLPPADSVADAVGMLDRQMAARRFRGIRPMGPLGDRCPTPTSSRAPGAQSRLRTHDASRSTRGGGDEAGRLRRTVHGRRAHRLAPFVVCRRTGDVERPASTRWPALGDNVVCKLSGLAMPLESMTVESLSPWLGSHWMCSDRDVACSPAIFRWTPAGTFDDLYHDLQRGDDRPRRPGS